MLKLVFASSNQDKITEASRISGEQIEWLSLVDVGITNPTEIEETGLTFAQNAYLKAERYVGQTQFPVIGEDTGLCVMALDGKPGLYSNRWFPGTADDRNQELLRRLKNQPDRSAEFIDVICLIYPDQPQSPLYFTGRTRGQIVNLGRGQHGFGYDPLFQPEGSQKTYAEMSPDQKNLVSHRAKAIQLLIEHLQLHPS